MTAEHERPRVDPAFAHFSERYGYASWRDSAPSEETLHVWRFSLGRAALPGLRPERIQPMDPRPPWPRSLESIWAPERGDGALVSVFVFECEGRAAARAVLLESLGQFQAKLERRDGPGEVAFGLKEKETVLLFASANVVAVVRNAGRKAIPVTTVAGELQRHIVERPEGKAEVLPEIVHFVAGEADSRAESAVPLLIEARDPLDRPLWFKLFATSGEVLEEDGRLVYHRTGPGPYEITLYAINENGGATSRTVRIGTR